MNENTEIIFNLFLFEFYFSSIGVENTCFNTLDSWEDYDDYRCGYDFKIVKDCFPENEFCEHGKWVTLNWIEGE
jgi:hypothetical protein